MLDTAPLCMANNCRNEAAFDIEAWPLCRRCHRIKQDIAHRWGPREHPEGTHARKEILGGEES